MLRGKATLPPSLPKALLSLVGNAPVYDSSSSPTARVYFIDVEGGVYLKTAAKGALAREAEMTSYFHSLGLAPAVLAYHSQSEDWLLTERARGTDATAPHHLADPRRLADTLAEALWRLHSLRAEGCPVLDRMTGYFELVEQNYRRGVFDPSLLGAYAAHLSADRAYAIAQEGRKAMGRDTLIHGDYCLPNIMLKNGCFSAFIDLGNGGLGDRHVDLFWGAWSLWYNLQTDVYSHRFLDAYGRAHIDRALLRAVAAAECFG